VGETGAGGRGGEEIEMASGKNERDRRVAGRERGEEGNAVVMASVVAVAALGIFALALTGTLGNIADALSRAGGG
jgi:hypothetical protein